MNRRIYLLLGLVAAGAGALAIYLGSPAVSSANAVTDPAPVSQPTPTTTPAVATPAPGAASAKTTAQWIADTASGDAATRAAAITALADAPKAEALPVLGRLLTNGEPQVDRVLALRSLRDLALNQGDADGAIRDAIRHAIYHGDDLTKVEDVQEALDIIEESELHQ